MLWVNSYQLVLISRSHARVSMHCYPIGCVIKSTHRGICSCSPIVNFLKFTFYHGMVTSVIFLIKNLNRHIKHENPLSIYENVDYFQIMSITNQECIARPPHQPPVILSGTPEVGLAPLTCGCWPINYISANIGHRNSIRILNQYPFWWNILIRS